jgi:opacity protein-like surface antigen
MGSMLSSVHCRVSILWLGLLIPCINTSADVAGEWDKSPRRSGWYLSGQIGASFHSTGDLFRTDVSRSGAPPSPASSFMNTIDMDRDFSPALVSGMEVGYQVSNAAIGIIRLGLEFNYRFDHERRINTTDRESKLISSGTGSVSSAVTLAPTSTVRSFTSMMNVQFDLHQLAFYRGGTLVPWIGVGVGWSQVRVGDRKANYSIDLQYAKPPADDRIHSRGRFGFTSGTDQGFAWQVMTGVSYSKSPKLVIDIGYRYVNLGAYGADSGVTARAFAASHGETVAASVSTHSDSIEVQEVFLCFRYLI